MSFEALYQAYWPKIFRLCRSYVNDPDLAQDLAQETFINVWQQLPRFRHEAAIGTWIFRIAVNQCLRQLEKEQRFPQTEMPVNLPEEPATALEPQLQFLYHCIGELAELDRLIISLELEALNQADIAIIVGLSPANVRVRIHRIKEKLTNQFKHYEP